MNADTVTSSPAAYALMPGQGPAEWYMGNLFEWKAETAALSVAEATAQPGSEPPLHVHQREDEAYLVLNGQATFQVGDEHVDAGPGTFVYLPRGVPHAFAVHSEVARFLLVVTPGGLEEHFHRFATEAAERTLPPRPETPPLDAIGADLAARGVQIVGPPLAVLLGGA